jgi:hypothetical protein
MSDIVLVDWFRQGAKVINIGIACQLPSTACFSGRNDALIRFFYRFSFESQPPLA